MASVNKAIIVGHLGQDPETRFLPSGDAVTNLSIATTDKWKDKASGEMREQTEWHKVAFFGRLAEVAGEYLKKGSLVYVEGSIHTRKYQDKDGVEKYATSIKGSALQMLSGKSTDTSKPEPKPAAKKPAKAGSMDDLDDDIPF